MTTATPSRPPIPEPPELPPGLESPPQARELTAQGRVQRLRHDVPGWEEAVPLLREAIELAPSYAPAYAELSETYSAWGLRRDECCLGFRREASLLEFQSLYDLAYDYAETAARLAPQLAAAHRALASALRRGSRADPERRAREAHKAVELDPKDPENLIERWRVEGYEPDDRVFREVLAREPGLLAARLDLAAALVDRGRVDEALAELMTALKAGPGNIRIYHDIAMALDRKGQRARAVALLKKTRELRRDPLIDQGLAMLGEAS